jgi:hypothetical protein
MWPWQCHTFYEAHTFSSLTLASAYTYPKLHQAVSQFLDFIYVVNDHNRKTGHTKGRALSGKGG